jgi:AcrR family transcriptional regulator
MAGGRPRSKEADCAIVAAALSLLAKDGYQNLTMEAIAERAGVGRPTLYRRWPSKASLVLDAYLCATYRSATVPDTGSAERDLRLFMRRLFRSLNGTDDGRTLANFVADAQSDPELLNLFRERLVLPRRGLAKAILDRGIRRGELRKGIDTEIFFDLLYGPMWYRLLIAHGPLSSAFADSLVRDLMRVIQEEKPKHQKSVNRKSTRLVTRSRNASVD